MFGYEQFFNDLKERMMNTLELIKDAALFGGTVPNERAQEVRDYLKEVEKLMGAQEQVKNIDSIADVVRCDSCNNNDDFSETGKKEICIEEEYRYVTATICNNCGKAVEIDFFD